VYHVNLHYRHETEGSGTTHERITVLQYMLTSYKHLMAVEGELKFRNEES
jgi:hypothetical protein